MLRVRDLIETKDNLILYVVSYRHPRDRYIAYLRYYPSDEGERSRGVVRFRKASTEESFDYLRRNYPEYLFYSEEAGAEVQCVPRDKVRRIHRPEEKLREIYRNARDDLEKKVVKLSEALGAIPLEYKGVTGSLLAGLHVQTSDIDFVVYGTRNFDLARRVLASHGGGMEALSEDQWRSAYLKRFPGRKDLSFEEFLWHETRKHAKGCIEGSVFDILFVRDQRELAGSYLPQQSKRIGPVVKQLTVVDASLAFDYPSVYKVRDDDGIIEEIACYTHTYAGQAMEGEEIEVAGVLERIRDEKKERHRILVGTTRETEGEYIKVKK